jgi:hypothetical protein
MLFFMEDASDGNRLSKMDLELCVGLDLQEFHLYEVVILGKIARLDRVLSALSSRPLFTSSRGEKGMKKIPMQRMTAGMPWMIIGVLQCSLCRTVARSVGLFSGSPKAEVTYPSRQEYDTNGRCELL